MRPSSDPQSAKRDSVSMHRLQFVPVFFFSDYLATNLRPEFAAVYETLSKSVANRAWDLSKESIGIRAMRNTALSYLTTLDNTQLAFDHYQSADCMTDKLAGMFLTLSDFIFHLLLCSARCSSQCSKRSYNNCDCGLPPEG